jgi:multidrug efflux pump subunit AcrA (membrane-fusion protein)
MVAVTLRAAQRREVEVGMPVELLDEASNSDYRATVLSIDGATTIGADGQPGFTASMVPSAETPLPFETVGQSLRVTIAAASTGTRRLVVPVTAMTSAADGSDFVSVVSAGALVTTKPSRVRVKAGLSADGYVTVEPVESGSLAVGDQVVVGR